MTVGCDVSRYQGAIDWQKMARQGATFCYIRSSFGLNADPTFAENWKNAKHTTVSRGLYHYFRPDVDPEEQAKFISTLVAGDWGEMPPAVDLEYNPTVDGAAARPTIHYYDQVTRFVDELDCLSGEQTIVYSSKGHLITYWGRPTLPDLYNKWAALGRRPLWIANYASDKRVSLPAPTIPLPWVEWHIWQKSADGNGMGNAFGVSSRSIDLNEMRV